MLTNSFKKAFIDQMNDSLQEMKLVFSDMSQSIIKMRAIAKKCGDDESAIWLLTLENKIFGIKEKIEKLNRVFNSLLRDHIEDLNCCLHSEIGRIERLKTLLRENDKAKYIAQLSDIEKDISDVMDLTE